jgi:hypothetical protein
MNKREPPRGVGVVLSMCTRPGCTRVPPGDVHVIVSPRDAGEARHILISLFAGDDEAWKNWTLHLMTTPPFRAHLLCPNHLPTIERGA